VHKAILKYTRAILSGMQKEEYIIVSDLHLCEGVDSPNEDFYYDKEFAAFLKHHSKKNTTLIINGDFVDFLQVTNLGHFKNITENERRFGLGTEEVKSMYKLKLVFEQHPLFFKGIADFIAKGNKVIIVAGNHDMEFYWKGTQETFYRELQKIRSIKNIRAKVKFYPWFYYVPGLVYVEHGNQYDPVNSYDNFLYPVLANNTKQLDLPFGSFFVRYFFNVFEKSDPLADNFKPPIKYINIALTKDPLHFTQTLMRYIPFLFRVWAKSIIFQNRKVLRKIEKINDARIDAVAKSFKLSPRKLHSIRSFHKQDLLNRPFFMYHVIKSHMYVRRSEFLKPVARHIKKSLGVKFVVFGHTHKAFRSGFMLNTGTWTQIVEHKRVYEVGKKLNYVHIAGGKATLKEWT
jgi:UDP-2,3-diacylglucosamine pyrophosphatase LpxH